MKTITINLYEFKELSKEVQEKVIQNLCDINVGYEWWDSTYEDAKNIDLLITGFNLDRSKHAKGNFIHTPGNTARLILKEHGEETETYKLAGKFLTECENYQELEDLEEQFLTDLLNEYANMLQKESEYLQSKEAIIETIEANEYTFEANGKMRNAK